MSTDPRVVRCEQAAAELADALQEAFDGGVPPIILIPALVTVFKTKGIEIPVGFGLTS